MIITHRTANIAMRLVILFFMSSIPSFVPAFRADGLTDGYVYPSISIMMEQFYYKSVNLSTAFSR